MKVARMIIAAVIASSSFPSLAANWWTVAAGGDSIVFVDADSIRSVRTNVFEVWSEWHNKTPDRDGDISNKSLSRIDCERRATTRLAYVYYKPNGSVGASNTIEEFRRKEEFAAPDTLGEAVLLFVCGDQKYRNKTGFIHDGIAPEEAAINFFKLKAAGILTGDALMFSSWPESVDSEALSGNYDKAYRAKARAALGR